MKKSSDSPSLQEEGELSNDSDTDNLFVVDCAPTGSHDRLDVPVYDQKFGEVLQVKSESDDSKPKGPKRAPYNTCWNCGGEHSLRECEAPRNYEAINRNRMIFMSKTPRSKGNRYHLDETTKFPHIQAGKISKRLRRALGLQSNQLPRHIYRMRCLGYPPGWVEEARVSHSGLSLFNSEGKEVADPGFEDGEVVAEGEKDKFDIKKIIAYPGYNCPCDADVIDEYERLNSKPMAERDGIKFLKLMWQSKAVKAYKRRKMNASESGTPKVDKRSSLLLLDDMELESDENVNSDSGGADSSNEDGNITEIKDTESGPSKNPADVPQATKRAGSESPSSPPSLKKQRVEVDEAFNGNGESCDSSLQVKIDDSAEPKGEKTTESESKPVTPTMGRVTSVSLGTPVIVTSPFTHLPSADKFAKNICDVINFENLPDSTGKYEKMSGLIKKVRTFVTKLSSEDDED